MRAAEEGRERAREGGRKEAETVRNGFVQLREETRHGHVSRNGTSTVQKLVTVADRRGWHSGVLYSNRTS